MALEIQQGINQLISSSQWAIGIAVHQPNVQEKRKTNKEIKDLKKQKETLQKYDNEFGNETEFFRHEIDKIPDMTQEQKDKVIKDMESADWYQRHEKDFTKQWKAIENKLGNLDPKYKQEGLMKDFKKLKNKTYGDILRQRLTDYAKNHQADSEARHMILNPEPKIKPREVNKDGN